MHWMSFEEGQMRRRSLRLTVHELQERFDSLQNEAEQPRIEEEKQGSSKVSKVCLQL